MSAVPEAAKNLMWLERCEQEKHNREMCSENLGEESFGRYGMVGY